jgi:hypothetical protein
MERQVPVELIREQAVCHPSCGVQTTIVVRRVAVTQIRAGWTVNGAGQAYDDTGRCPSCGSVCRAIVTHLPVELGEVPCPTCHQPIDFEYDLSCVESNAGVFSFTATVRCPGCSSRTFARRIVEGLRRIKRLKLGPTGIEVDIME